MELLQETLNIIKIETNKYGYHQHYAIKANANPKILKRIAENGFGADCVSGGEIRAALAAGFPPSKIVFAGVGKADWEIQLGLDENIACFNVESLAELEVINCIAGEKNKIATISLRVNPNVDAHTHAKITTGLQENKFGINLGMLNEVIGEMKKMTNIRFSGLHFHIGSQITDMSAFRDLSIRVNEIQEDMEKQGLKIDNLNFGGGLGIDYHHPNHLCIPEFENYFSVFHKLVKQREGQQIHFELGRSVVAQCGSLISKVLYVKKGEVKQFAILDAGFTELIRPAMYDAYHRIENITSDEQIETYDVVGPICESSDIFGKDRELNQVRRNDLVALRSAGAYGEIMALQYNCRPLPESYFSNEL
jgi:diaminopimelate decarboxylase